METFVFGCPLFVPGARFLLLNQPFIYQLVDMTLASQKFLLVSQNYHPLEELKPGKRVQETKLSPAEVARTAVEVCT